MQKKVKESFFGKNNLNLLCGAHCLCAFGAGKNSQKSAQLLFGILH